jgi:hypothetical protein
MIDRQFWWTLLRWRWRSINRSEFQALLEMMKFDDTPSVRAPASNLAVVVWAGFVVAFGYGVYPG